MRSAQLTLGRQFVVAFDHGEDFFTALDQFCEENRVRSGFVRFIAGFREVDLVGTSDKLENPDAPVWSKVHLENVEVHGSGDLAWDETTGKVAPHIHVSAGEKARSAVGHTSHLLGARVQFLTEMHVIEVVEPQFTRVRDSDLHGAPLLRF